MTSRTQRVRVWLSGQTGSFTSRDILNAVEPRGSVSVMCGTLDFLAKQGDVLRKKSGGVCRYKISAQGLKAANDEPLIRPSKPVAPKLPTSKPAPVPVRAVAKAKPAPKPLVVKPAKAAAEKAVPMAARPMSSRYIACSLSGIPAANQLTRDRIAADTAAFLRRGGKIERLGATQFFQHIKPANDASANKRPALNTGSALDTFNDQDD